MTSEGIEPGSREWDLLVREREVQSELDRLRVQHEARRRFAAETWAGTWTEPDYATNLTAELAIGDDPIEYAVESLHPRGGNTNLAAQYKSGKTTLLLNLARSLVDGTPFLGKFAAKKAAGRVAFWNYEVSRGQFRYWCRQLDITNSDDLVPLTLRGHRLALSSPQGEQWAVRWLQAHDVSTWIIDPFGRAFRGAGSENSNDDVGAFLDSLDAIKSGSGVEDLFLSSHTGRQQQREGEERVRGATVLDDWPDARWVLTKEQSQRFLRAEGRDVATDNDALGFDPETLTLTATNYSKHDARMERHARFAVEALKRQDGLSATDLRKAMEGDNTYKDAGIRQAVDEGWIELRVEGKKHAHYLKQSPPPRLRLKGATTDG